MYETPMMTRATADHIAKILPTLHPEVKDIEAWHTPSFSAVDFTIRGLWCRVGQGERYEPFDHPDRELAVTIIEAARRQAYEIR